MGEGGGGRGDGAVWIRAFGTGAATTVSPGQYPDALGSALRIITRADYLLIGI